MSEEILKKESGKIVRPPREYFDRAKATVFVLLLIAIIALCIVILKDDLVHQKIEEYQNKFLDYVGTQGFGIDDVIIIGRNRTTLDEIKGVLDVSRGDNILKINVKKLKQQLENLPWVRDVYISRSFFPNVLQVEIEEKQVLAIWQLNEKFYPLDMDGYVIEADYRPDNPILLIVGTGAAENVLSLLKVIKNTDEKYLERIKVANYISKRRWNVILDDIREGVTIKLPEENVEKAWKKLLKLEASKGILKRKLTIIDLRLEDKVTVKLYKSKLKAHKSEQKI